MPSFQTYYAKLDQMIFLRIGIPLLILPILYLQRKNKLDLETLVDPSHWLFNMLIPILLVAALFWSFLVYRPLIVKAKAKSSFAEQLEGFRKAQLVRFNWTSVTAWGACILYFLSNGNEALVLFVLALFLSSVYRPSRQNIIKQLSLGDVEEDIVWKDLDY